uniref:Uncharacterized protein n=1 Tax=Molossus molossus TaxID=27622 RepID=A0A7J8F900_MOLMO|nr:hypothetical protein HJG59_008457 [Molossus molossus]
MLNNSSGCGNPCLVADVNGIFHSGKSVFCDGVSSLCQPPLLTPTPTPALAQPPPRCSHRWTQRLQWPRCVGWRAQQAAEDPVGYPGQHGVFSTRLGAGAGQRGPWQRSQSPPAGAVYLGARGQAGSVYAGRRGSRMVSEGSPPPLLSEPALFKIKLP